jgi:ABC-2 type transport system ATP-binding protein
VIELIKLTKKFGSRLAVDELSLKVPAGEIYGLLGHNGAGKSTAIGMMLGQIWPDGGQAKICGYDVTVRRCQALQKVGAIFESPAFYDYLSGFRNLQILSSYTAPTSRQRIAEVLDWVGLTGREQNSVRTYSHGMRARLALAQALLPRPELLILDEPSDGLDPEGIHEMRQTILRLHHELKLTILLSSHLLNEVEQLCTRIAVLNRGRMVFEGSLSETRNRAQQVRLRVGDFEVACRHLRQLGLIVASADGKKVTLSPGAQTENLVKELVSFGMPVHEIAFEQETLEQFYLTLMNDQRAGDGSRPEIR